MISGWKPKSVKPYLPTLFLNEITTRQGYRS
jgi:hypothetical protein